MRPLTQRERRLVALAILTGLAALVWVGVIDPVVVGAIRRAQDRQDLQEQVERAERLAAILPNLRSSAARQTAQTRQYVIEAASPIQAAELLKQRIGTVMQDEGGKVKSVQSVDESGKDQWVTVRADIQATHDQLIRAIAKLEDEEPNAVIDSLSVAADRSAATGRLEQLEISLGVSAQFQPGKPVPAAPAGERGTVRRRRRPNGVVPPDVPLWRGRSARIGPARADGGRCHGDADARGAPFDAGSALARHRRPADLCPDAPAVPHARDGAVPPGHLDRGGNHGRRRRWGGGVASGRRQDHAGQGGADGGGMDLAGGDAGTAGFPAQRRHPKLAAGQPEIASGRPAPVTRSAGKTMIMLRPLIRAVALLTLSGLLLGCVDNPFLDRFQTGAVPTTQSPAANQASAANQTTAQTTPAAPAANSPPSSQGTRTEVLRGTQRFVAPAQTQTPAPATLAQAQAPVPPGTVSLNFVNVDVRDVARAVLGDMLNVAYSVDPGVNGVATVETPQPIRPEDVMPVLEAGLKAAGFGLVMRDRAYVITTVADARRQPGMVNRQTVGYGTEAVSLRYANAAQLKKLFDPMVPDNTLHVDTARNVIMVTGSSSERDSLRAMVAQFDVDWLAGMSYALITLQRADARRMADELNQIVNADNSPSAGLVRLIPLSRLNGIIVVSPQPQYIDDVRYWAEELDREGEDSEKQLFVYRVQSGRASDMATVLSNLFGAGGQGQKGGGGASPAMAAQTPMQTMTSTTIGGGRGASQPSAGLTTASQPSAPMAGAAMGGVGGQSAGVGSGQVLRLGDSNQTISVTSDDGNNAIVVYATAREYEVIERALRKLDVLPLQVLIEAMITEVSLNDTLRYGVEWYFKTGNNQFSLTSGTTKAPVQSLPGFSYLLQGGNSMQTVVNALDEVSHVDVISSPRLLVLNNQTAALQVGDQVPISTQSSVSTVANSSVINSIEYRDTGVILKVTPRVNDSGLVLLDISQEISDVSTTTSSSLDSPTIQQRKVSSSVAVQDGQTVALGGLIRDNVRRTESGVPLLKEMPLLGNLFSGTNNSRGRTELLVLLTPHVVRNAADAQAITDELRRSIATVKPIARPTPSVPAASVPAAPIPASPGP